MAEVIDHAMDYSISAEYQHVTHYIQKERELRETHIKEVATTARARGMSEGKTLGQFQAQLKSARNLLSHGFEHAEVAKLTE